VAPEPIAIDPSVVAPNVSVPSEVPEPARQPESPAAEPPAPAPVVDPPFGGSSQPAESDEPPENRPPPEDRERLILVADPEIETGKITAGALADWGLSPILVHDGVEAILSIQRMLPSAIVIDAALPKMFGFQVCELLKRNESLRDIHVVLVGAIHNRERYRRAPSELYGADAYLERHELPQALRETLTGFGVPLTVPSSTPAPAPVEPSAVPEPPVPTTPVEAPAPEPVAEPSPPAPVAQAEPQSDPAIAEAERLARIVVSDIILYNQEKFDAAVRAGNVVQAMENELAEGRSLFASRIDARVRDERDFLAEQLLAVARSRGAG
jgi:CheY-like chemotaxis protein